MMYGTFCFVFRLVKQFRIPVLIAVSGQTTVVKTGEESVTANARHPAQPQVFVEMPCLQHHLAKNIVLPFGRPFFFTRNTLRSSATAPADLKTPKGLWLGLVWGWL